ncbi:MAG: CDP-2,3-bis-(O-geranylgeranyl)-sn-glycerol synthase [Thermoproteus sp.]
MSILQLLAYSLVLIWPPYVANGLAVLASALPRRHPIDLGRSWRGSRIFGDGKTFEGFAIGLALGTTIGWLPNLLYSVLSVGDTAVLSASALVGDLIGAFIKRRLCLPRGHPAFPLDQLDFLLMSLLVYSLYAQIPITAIFISVIITPAIHRATNIAAYRLRLKKEPW